MSAFRLYLVAIGFAAFATGMQIVLLPWLAVGELRLAANMVGWVQSAVLLPGVFLTLWAGAFADRARAVRFLPWVYGFILLSHLGVLLYVGFDLLALPTLLIYAFCLGVFHAFVQPLRDKVLPMFVPSFHKVQTAVVQISLCVYVAQALGVALAGQSQKLGLVSLFTIQVGALLGCVWAFSVLLRRQVAAGDAVAPASQGYGGSVRGASVYDGLVFVFRHRVLRHLMILVAFNGFIHIGVFMVALPLLVRDVYQLDAFYFSALQLLFVLGNIVATLALLRRGQVEHPGRAVLFSLLYAGVVMLAISARPTPTGLLFLVFVWGVVAGVSASLGKAIVQQQVDEDYRGRVLSVYQLALFGGAPLGALACGYVTDVWGCMRLFQIGGGLTLAFFVLSLGARPLWGAAALPSHQPD